LRLAVALTTSQGKDHLRMRFHCPGSSLFMPVENRWWNSGCSPARAVFTVIDATSCRSSSALSSRATDRLPARDGAEINQGESFTCGAVVFQIKCWCDTKSQF